jgi:hypothetical protein
MRCVRDPAFMVSGLTGKFPGGSEWLPPGRDGTGSPRCRQQALGAGDRVLCAGVTEAIQGLGIAVPQTLDRTWASLPDPDSSSRAISAKVCGPAGLNASSLRQIQQRVLAGRPGQLLPAPRSSSSSLTRGPTV